MHNRVRCAPEAWAQELERPGEEEDEEEEDKEEEEEEEGGEGMASRQLRL